MNIPDYNPQRIEATSEWTPERVALTGRNIVLITAGGIAFGMFAAAMQLYWISALIGAALLMVLVAWRFEIALVVYALIAFVPWGGTPDLAVGGSGVGKGLFVSQIMLGFLLVVWFAKYLLVALPKNRIYSGFYIPIGLYLAYSIMNVAHSYLFWDPHVNRMHQHPMVNVIELGLRFLSVGALIIMATAVATRRWLTWTTIALLIPGCYAVLNGLLGGRIPISAPWASLLTLLPACYLWAIALDSCRAKRLRVLAVCGVVLAVVSVFVLNISWISGWFGLFVGLGMVTLVKSRKLFLVLLVLVGLACTLAWPFLHENVVQSSQSEGDYDRFEMMRAAFLYASRFPLGVGLGNYRSYNSFYYGREWGTTSYTSAHGTYSQHLSEMGFPGFVLILSVLFFGLRWMLACYRSLPPGWSRTYLLAAAGQITGIGAAAFIGDYLLPTYHNGGIITFSSTIYSWLIWGLAVSHVRISRSEVHGSVDSHS